MSRAERTFLHFCRNDPPRIAARNKRGAMLQPMLELLAWLRRHFFGEPERASRIRMMRAPRRGRECTVCNASCGFDVTIYDTGAELRCPALRCRSCGALTLDEAAARSEDERICVRATIASRALLLGVRPPSPAE